MVDAKMGKNGIYIDPENFEELFEEFLQHRYGISMEDFDEILQEKHPEKFI